MQVLGEFDIIRRFFDVDVSGRRDVAIGIGDDAAVLRTPPGELVMAVDGIIEIVHFPEGTPARAVGHRALAVNLSDLAAMGARPLWATLALSLPLADETWLADFAAGFFELANRHGVALVGGDTMRGPLQVVVQVTGNIPQGTALTRGGGRPGDGIWLSGPVGDAAAGLRLFSREGGSDPLAQRFLFPRPRVDFGLGLREFASAAIDISDGLAVDLRRIAIASGCGARIDLDRVPLSDAMVRRYARDERIYLALNGGDDYELCFTVPESRQGLFESWLQDASFAATRIGELCEGEALVMQQDGQVVTPPVGGYDHFGGDV